MSAPGADRRSVRVGSRTIGPGEPTYVVAEMSGNHGGRLERALAMIDAAAQAGADAVKIQVYRPDTITLDSDKPDFRIATDNAWAEHRTLHQLYQAAHTPWEWLSELFARAGRRGIALFGSVFDHSSVAALECFDPPAYKIAAPEICDLPLLRTVAATGKPVLLSTGLASLADLATAVDVLVAHGAGGIVLLKCSTAYPAPEDEINLRTIPNLAETFACPAGFSDHTLGMGVALAAVALGAQVIEKHFTLDDEDTVDGFFSLQADAFAAMIAEIHRAGRALGQVEYSVTPAARANAQGRRSLYVAAPIAAGERFTAENVKSVRPGYGMDTRYYDIVLGRRATRNLAVGDRLSWDVVG